MINKNDSTISAIYKWNGEIGKIYRGGNIIHQKDPQNDYVDLGLPSGKLWAKGNIIHDGKGGYKIGSENDRGAYFSWGNIVPRFLRNEEYFYDGYSFSELSYKNTPGYLDLHNSYDNIANDDIEHNAALSILGEPWTIPTIEDFQELYNNTNLQWISIGGIYGWKFANKTNPDLYIFLPAVGTSEGPNISAKSSCYYWSSSADGHSDYAKCLTGNRNYVDSNFRQKRYYGQPIRAIRSAMLDAYYFTIGTEDFWLDFAGDERTYTVTSYKETEDGIQTPLAWTATYSIDNGNTWKSVPSSWVESFTAGGEGGSSPASLNLKVSKNTSSTVTPKLQLKANTPVLDYDLSLHDVQGNETLRNTANCYMVHAAGTYKLPLVYGNAIKNGATNSTAYNPSGTNSETFLKPFLNHAGVGIVNPWLKNNSAAPDGATVVWLTKRGLISSPSIDGDYLTFTINSDNIDEGNAVIAATMDGTVVWSWHIWVTNETFNNLIPLEYRGATHNYTVTPINIGWCSNSSLVPTNGYFSRLCLIKFTQTETGLEEIRNFYQHSVSTKGNSVGYQFGRKDPLYGVATSLYDGSGGTVSLSQSDNSNLLNTSIANTIQNPSVHYCTETHTPYAMYDGNLYNYWDATRAGYTAGNGYTTKTIYDPCPPGFCVPPAQVLYACANNRYNFTWEHANHGKTIVRSSGNKELFLPAVGYHTAEGGRIYEYGISGRYWSSLPYEYRNFTAESLRLDSSDTSAYTVTNYRSFGYSIRAITEE